jgi:hypothetical protein
VSSAQRATEPKKFDTTSRVAMPMTIPATPSEAKRCDTDFQRLGDGEKGEHHQNRPEVLDAENGVAACLCVTTPSEGYRRRWEA